MCESVNYGFFFLLVISLFVLFFTKHSIRSSQISMASTNPFETDDDDDENNEDISLAGDRLMITSTPNKQRIHRKKRRAPAPPTVGVCIKFAIIIIFKH